VHAYSDWYYYMVTNPVDRIQTVWIRPDSDFAGSSYCRIRSDLDPKKTPDIRPDPDPDPVHL